MEILLLVLTLGLPILKIVLWPARTMGRGGNWTLVGAAMIVCLMMALWFGMQSVTDVGDAAAASVGSKPAQAGDQLPDLDALSRLF
ncbi:MAG: hypothetical protein ACTHOR_13205 [Devosia sp.]|jgi:hypothetical protein